jgi:hypothetical protein
LFVAIFGAACAVTIIEAMRRLRGEMVDAQSPVAIRALPDLCLGIIFQLGHLRLPTNLVQMASPGPSRARGGSGRLANARACDSRQWSVLRFRRQLVSRHTQSCARMVAADEKDPNFP